MWIEWNGGEQPVVDDSRVEVKFRDGKEAAGYSEDFDWEHGVMSDDIVAYRVVS